VGRTDFRSNQQEANLAKAIDRPTFIFSKRKLNKSLKKKSRQHPALICPLGHQANRHEF
jgi:hypothetical protein